MSESKLPPTKLPFSARIVAKERLSEDAVTLTLQAPAIANTVVPGQFVNVQTDQFLRRPLGIMARNLKLGTVTIGIKVVGQGTEWLSHRQEGETLSLLGPLGHGFDFSGAERVITVGGGTGVFPLYFVQQFCREQNLESLAVCGYRSQSESLLASAYEQCGCQVLFSSDAGDMDIKGHAAQALEQLLGRLSDDKRTIIMGCGPKPMLKAVAATAAESGHACQVSLEERMACGIGVCLVCACKLSGGQGERFARCCVEGPVFAAEEVAW